MLKISHLNITKNKLYILCGVVLSVLVIIALLSQDDDGLIVDSTIVIPQGQTGPLPNFSKFENVVEKKKAFFGYLLPEIEKQNALILQERAFLIALQEKVSWTAKDRETVNKLADKYKVEDAKDQHVTLTKLLKRVDIIPAELVLAQAANESAWGTSRFAQNGYNFFGMWCFKKGCGFVPKLRDDEAVHEVTKFKDLSHAVGAYLRNLNRHPAYKNLRDIRFQLRLNNQAISADELVHGLSSYSERGQEYINELLDMISYNRKYMHK